jgi:lysophospholipase L1-like esterase
VQGNLKGLGVPVASYEIDVAYDANGFRNDKDFTAADVIAIGDSFVEGAEVPQARTMVAQLGRILDADVVNLGQSNYGPQQELVVLKRYAVPLKPKAVVWFFFGGNDLEDVVSYEERRSHYEELLAPPSLGARSFTRNALRAVAALTTPPRREPSPAGRLHAAVFTRRDGTHETLYLDRPEGPWEPRRWEVASGILSEAHDVTRRMKADFLVVFIPRKLRVYRGFLQAEPGAHALTWKDNNLPDVLGAWCRDKGIAFLDSTQALRSAAASGESVYLPDDVHWNAAGHRVVATAVAERLRQWGGVPASREEHIE